MQSPPGGHKRINSPAKLQASQLSPTAQLHLPLPDKLELPSVEKKLRSPKGSKAKGHAQCKAKLNSGGPSSGNSQNQMNLSFSNALEFQQLLASKYGAGSFPASDLLTAAAKAQGTGHNPLTQALTQLQHGLTQSPPKGKKGRAKKSSGATIGNKIPDPNAMKKDEFHASSFIVNESGQLESTEALVSALLSNPTSSQAQVLLQHLAATNGLNSGGGLDPDQLAASHAALMNMAAGILASSTPGSLGNNTPTPTSAAATAAPTAAASNAPPASKDSGSEPPVMTALDVAHNAIVNAFNASNISDMLQAKKPVARTKRRRSAPQGDTPSGLSGVTPTKCARPRSAPGGNVLPPPPTNAHHTVGNGGKAAPPVPSQTGVASAASPRSSNSNRSSPVGGGRSHAAPTAVSPAASTAANNPTASGSTGSTTNVTQVSAKLFASLMHHKVLSLVCTLSFDVSFVASSQKSSPVLGW